MHVHVQLTSFEEYLRRFVDTLTNVHTGSRGIQYPVFSNVASRGCLSVRIQLGVWFMGAEYQTCLLSWYWGGTLLGGCWLASLLFPSLPVVRICISRAHRYDKHSLTSGLGWWERFCFWRWRSDCVGQPLAILVCLYATRMANVEYFPFL